MGKVSIVKTNNGIKSALINALDLIGGLEKYIQHNDYVMLKPNLNGTEGVTNLELVESIIQLLLDYGVRRLVIGESTFGNQQMTDMFFNKTGYSELARKYSIDLINLNKSEIIEVDVKKPLMLDKIKIAKEVFEVDKIINIPIMKVHYATGITLSMKNLKGLLVREEKRHFHEVGLDKTIVDLNNTIKPSLNIVDCISCMERLGPRGGDIVNLNLILAGENSAEVDYIGSQIMGYGLDEVKHLQIYIDGNNIDLNAIEIAGESVADVKYNFKKVSMENIIPKGINVKNINACCSCMNALLLSCQFLEKEITKDINVYLGSKIDDNMHDDDSIKIAFGNCCNENIKYDKVIRGCPPFPFELKNNLEDL